MRNYFPDFPSLLRFSGDVISGLNKTRGRGGKRDKSCESHFFIVMKKYDDNTHHDNDEDNDDDEEEEEYEDDADGG